MHALLFRKWKTRVKGRDWYDLEWYVRQGVPLNLNHLSERIRQSGELKGQQTNPQELLNLLHERIANLNVSQAALDIKPFLNDKAKLDIWSENYFTDLIKHLKIQE